MVTLFSLLLVLLFTLITLMEANQAVHLLLLPMLQPLSLILLFPLPLFSLSSLSKRHSPQPEHLKSIKHQVQGQAKEQSMVQLIKVLLLFMISREGSDLRPLVFIKQVMQEFFQLTLAEFFQVRFQVIKLLLVQQVQQQVIQEPQPSQVVPFWKPRAQVLPRHRQ